jgi:quinol monooxygenase YgiN
VVHLMAQFKVKDYKAWRMVFDKNTPMRKSMGELSVKLWRSEEDPNDLGLLFEWDNLENAHKFVASSELQKAKQEAGVIEPLQTRFFAEVS